MMRSYPRLALLFALVVWLVSGCGLVDQSGEAARSNGQAGHFAATAGALPPEARVVIRQILNGTSFAHPRDGAIFHNREQLLPRRPKGYYREYTVPTPGASNRGARRLVTGGTPPEVFYYTDDHYRSFRRVEPGPP